VIFRKLRKRQENEARMRSFSHVGGPVSLVIWPDRAETPHPSFMKILIAPDKFKGSLSAVAATAAISRGVRAVWPDAEITAAPIADGGEGFAEALGQALGAVWVETRAQDPLGREVAARYAWVESEKLAIIEMSEASGMWRLTKEERDPLRANTFGTGQLIRHATERGARKILVGLGGSATTDGGAGMAAALGYEFVTSDGEELALHPGVFIALTRIIAAEAIELPEIIAACDVQNPLLGPRGTARVFSPQKGASEKDVAALEAGMSSLADCVTTDLGCDFRETPGAGAAGGIAFGLMSFCGAKVCSGFELVAATLGLEKRVAASDLIFTGEGRIDRQTLEGKGPAGLAALARRHGKPIVALGGTVPPDATVEALFDAASGIVDEPIPLEAAMSRGEEFLERGATRAARLISLGTKL
jgi:glycerate kinase